MREERLETHFWFLRGMSRFRRAPCLSVATSVTAPSFLLVQECLDQLAGDTSVYDAAPNMPEPSTD